jgi:fatty-acyl-CoA synthase
MDSYPLTLQTALRRARREFGRQFIVSRDTDGDRVYTFEDCFRRVGRLAWALRGLGVRPGDAVATLAWNTREHLELYIAAVSMGAILHPVNLRLAPGQIADIIRRANDRVIFADGEALQQAGEELRAAGIDVPVVVLGRRPPALPAGSALIHDYEALLAAAPATEFDYDGVSESAPAAMAYSSATTGAPKGVVYSHRAMYLHTAMLTAADTWAIAPDDAVLPIVPMYHVNAWGLPFAALWAGARLILPGRRPDGAALARLLADATFSAAVPTVWMDVFTELRRSGVRLPGLRLAVCGGAALGLGLLREADELGVPLIHSYGMTEASPLVLVGRALPGVEFTTELRLKQGYVVPGLEYNVRDERGGEVPRDGRTPGELLLRGPWIVERYLDDDPRNATTFADGWYHTGDVVTIDAAGYVQLVDRKADIIKSGGEWISSIELENALMSHPAVLIAAVVGVPSERWQERPKAFVVAQERVEVAELQELLLARFPKFWLPDEFEFVPEIPLTSVGKIDKKKIRKRHDGG